MNPYKSFGYFCRLMNYGKGDAAFSYLLHEGIKKETVIKIGSPMFEVINFYKENNRERNDTNSI